MICYKPCKKNIDGRSTDYVCCIYFRNINWPTEEIRVLYVLQMVSKRFALQVMKFV